jgi:hypothetical protein
LRASHPITIMRSFANAHLIVIMRSLAHMSSIRQLSELLWSGVTLTPTCHTPFSVARVVAL